MQNVLLIGSENIFDTNVINSYRSYNLNTVICSDNRDAIKYLCRDKYQVCIIDITSLSVDCQSLFNAIKFIEEGIFIIFVSDKQSNEKKYTSFEMGCDDYMIKPFCTQELYLRVIAILRRSRFVSDIVSCNVGSSTFDTNRRTIVCNNITKKTTRIETKILKMLIASKGKSVAKNTLLMEVWGDLNHTNSLYVYLSKIRKILSDDSSIEIQNISGEGFMLVERISNFSNSILPQQVY